MSTDVLINVHCLLTVKDGQRLLVLPFPDSHQVGQDLSLAILVFDFARDYQGPLKHIMSLLTLRQIQIDLTEGVECPRFTTFVSPLMPESERPLIEGFRLFIPAH